MYKLMVVAGPSRGASYPVQEGETSIGRQSGNSVVLQSSRVSKKHCVLIARDGELVVRDNGSSNGTFVNGVLAKEKSVHTGDRISVGEFVFEVLEPRDRSNALPQQLNPHHSLTNPGAEVIPFPGHVADQGIGSSLGSDLSSGPAPQNFKEKAFQAFDHFVMPLFYGFALKNQWRIICLGVFAVFLVADLFVSINPLLESSRTTVVRESARRATFMARQMADVASPFLANRAETKVEVGAAETAEGVRLAIITDMENRIIAPPSRSNQYLTNGAEAVFLTRARDIFRTGKETGFTKEVDSNTVVAVEPIKAYNPQTSKNVTIGMALVSIDTTLATMGLGDVGLVYSESMIISALLAAFVLLILYRLTLKPLMVLGDDLDKVLKGDMGQVTHEFMFEELNPLWDLINSAIQRIPKSGSNFGGTGKVEPTLTVDDFIGPFKTLGSVGKVGIIVCDSEKKILYISPVFEELSGIRSDNSLGQEFATVARDQAMAALVLDLFERAQPGCESGAEDFEFSGVAHKVSAISFGTFGAPKCYVLIASRNE